MTETMSIPAVWISAEASKKRKYVTFPRDQGLKYQTMKLTGFSRNIAAVTSVGRSTGGEK